MIETGLDHVGIVVPALEPALEALSASLGVEWIRPTFNPNFEVEQEGRGRRWFQLRIACSVQYPRLEVIEALPDSPWALQDREFHLHHIAFHSRDLGGDSQQAIGQGCPIEICGVHPDGRTPKTFTYQVQNGMRFELLAQRSAFAGQGMGPPAWQLPV